MEAAEAERQEALREKLRKLRARAKKVRQRIAATAATNRIEQLEQMWALGSGVSAQGSRVGGPVPRASSVREHPAGRLYWMLPSLCQRSGMLGHRSHLPRRLVLGIFVLNFLLNVSHFGSRVAAIDSR